MGELRSPLLTPLSFFNDATVVYMKNKLVYILLS
nr:MAG TPA: hypothetical protein [Caudoviricetes sp.]